MSRNKPEAIIEREILIYLNSLPNSFFWKNETFGAYDEQKKTYRKSPNPYVIRGVSDIIGILKKRIIFIEVKTITGRESRFQKHFREKITALGGICFIARSIPETKFELMKRKLLDVAEEDD